MVEVYCVPTLTVTSEPLDVLSLHVMAIQVGGEPVSEAVGEEVILWIWGLRVVITQFLGVFGYHVIDTLAPETPPTLAYEQRTFVWVAKFSPGLEPGFEYLECLVIKKCSAVTTLTTGFEL